MSPNPVTALQAQQPLQTAANTLGRPAPVRATPNPPAQNQDTVTISPAARAQIAQANPKAGGA